MRRKREMKKKSSKGRKWMETCRRKRWKEKKKGPRNRAGIKGGTGKKAKEWGKCGSKLGGHE